MLQMPNPLIAQENILHNIVSYERLTFFNQKFAHR